MGNNSEKKNAKNRDFDGISFYRRHVPNSWSEIVKMKNYRVYLYTRPWFLDTFLNVSCSQMKKNTDFTFWGFAMGPSPSNDEQIIGQILGFFSFFSSKIKKWDFRAFPALIRPKSTTIFPRFYLNYAYQTELLGAFISRPIQTFAFSWKYRTK